jgi:fused signal recognition particle receptor
MRELGKIQKVVQKKIPGAPHEALLVLDATIGQNAINQARQFGEHMAVTGIILAKLDGSAKGGVVISIRDQLGVPVKFVGLGETPDDIEPFDPAAFIDAMLAT